MSDKETLGERITTVVDNYTGETDKIVADELRSTILKNSKSRSPEVLLEFNHRQLGFTDEWLAEKMADAKGSKETLESNFLNIWGAGSAASPIKKELLKILYLKWKISSKV